MNSCFVLDQISTKSLIVIRLAVISVLACSFPDFVSAEDLDELKVVFIAPYVQAGGENPPLAVKLSRKKLEGRSHDKFLDGDIHSAETRFAVWFHAALGHSVHIDRLSEAWPGAEDDATVLEAVEKARRVFMVDPPVSISFLRLYRIGGMSFLVVNISDTFEAGVKVSYPLRFPIGNTDEARKLFEKRPPPTWLKCVNEIIDFVEDCPIEFGGEMTRGGLSIEIPPGHAGMDGPKWEVIFHGNAYDVLLGESEGQQLDPVSEVVERSVELGRSNKWDAWLNLWSESGQKQLISTTGKKNNHRLRQLFLGEFKHDVRLLFTVKFEQVAAALVRNEGLDHGETGGVYWIFLRKDGEGLWRLASTETLGGSSDQGEVQQAVEQLLQNKFIIISLYKELTGAEIEDVNEEASLGD